MLKINSPAIGGTVYNCPAIGGTVYNCPASGGTVYNWTDLSPFEMNQ